VNTSNARMAATAAAGQAARTMRAVWRRVRAAASDRSTTIACPADHRLPAWATDGPPESAFILLAALVLGGLMDPAVAPAIALLETDHQDDHHRRDRWTRPPTEDPCATTRSP
jgi:hypothetical protein